MMRFTATAIAPLPDIATARLNFDLDTLSDEDVAKVLFHRRKQAGNGESLGWDQLRIGGVSLIRVDDQGSRIDTLTLNDVSEADLIEAIFRALQDSPPLVTWGGDLAFIPLLQFRCLKHRRSASEYWTRVEDQGSPHVDLQRELLGGSDDGRLALDDMAQRLALPGMLGHREELLWDRWLEGNHEAISTYMDYQALNTALLALEIFHLKGRCSPSETSEQRDALIELITRTEPSTRYADFLLHWARRK